MSAVSHGMGAGIDLAGRLIDLVRDPAFLPSIYPALIGAGIDEGSLHASMLSALVLAGDRLGFSPICDSPIFDRLDLLLTREGAKRPDAVWYGRGTQSVRCLIEFERYTRQSLALKARNLLMMGKELRDDLHLAVLSYWTYAALTDSELDDARRVFEVGFRHTQGVSFPPLACPALVLEMLVTAGAGRTRIAGFVPRLFVANGENKRYVVDMLARCAAG
jgi:hypothetical protein